MSKYQRIVPAMFKEFEIRSPNFVEVIGMYDKGRTVRVLIPKEEIEKICLTLKKEN